MRKILLAGVIAAVALLVVLPAVFYVLLDDEPPLSEEEVHRGVTEVTVVDNSYSPRVIEVAPGTEVTWIFDDDKQHDVKGDGWGSEVQESGTFVQAFAEPGTYDYECSLHPNMTGRVIVAG